MSQHWVSRLEAGALDGFSIGTLRRICATIGLDVTLKGYWRGGELARLLDADHAALQAAAKRALEKHGWNAHAEVTFSRYGERGSYDLLAVHPLGNVLLVVEVKTVIVDVQAMLRALDVKVRLAPTVARERGWPANVAVPCLIVAAGSTARRRILEHSPLFARFACRGLAARRWVRSPGERVGGLLFMLPLPPRPGRSVRRAGRVRVRRIGPAASVGESGRASPEGRIPA